MLQKPQAGHLGHAQLVKIVVAVRMAVRRRSHLLGQQGHQAFLKTQVLQTLVFSVSFVVKIDFFSDFLKVGLRRADHEQDKQAAVDQGRNRIAGSSMHVKYRQNQTA